MKKTVYILISVLVLAVMPSFAYGQDFSFSLLSSAAREDNADVIFLSPESISVALAMTANGANGITQEEILKTTGTGNTDIKSVNKFYRKQLEYLCQEKEGIILDIANSIWISDRWKMKRPTAKTIQKNYGASVSSLDFGLPSSVSVINGWCAENTEGRIKEIIDNISPADMMYLINAIYFKGLWSEPFNPSSSSTDIFHGTSGDAETKFMYRKGNYRFFSDGKVSVLELGYGDGSMAMDIILPAEGTDIVQFAEQFNSLEYKKIIGNMETTEVKARIPAFKAEYETNLNTVLKTLGMKTAFTSAADFSNFSRIPMSVSKVIHKTYIEVNEEGSEAAAVTAVGIMRTSLGPEPPAFTADRPFIFTIRDTGNGTILFCGMVRNL